METKTLTPIQDFDWNQNGNYISIALKVVERLPDQRHIGILHKKKNGPPSLLHLEWHYLISNEHLEEILDKKYFVYIPSHLDEEKARTIAGLCRQIDRRKPKIPYGIIFDKTRFSKDGILHLGEKSHGLTCATFIMAVFLSTGMDLLLEDQWPFRAEDEEWHSRIIQYLEATKEEHGITDAHIENIRNEKNCVRFRPEEVAASLSSEEIPASFKYASEVGLEFVRKLS